ncbi:MAG TPA: DNA internalization-related competence protein ComEC/Rec2 [Moraxellaceae bacterium]|nr:DNA internalization-related competence protein ComEC/Rec2 [Moraxellaceae bacterium]
MGASLAAAANGLLLLTVLPVLPPVWLPLSLAVGCLLLAWWRRRFWRAAACLFLAFAWSVHVAASALAARLPVASEGVTLRSTGIIEGLPELSPSQGSRFRFRPRTVQDQPAQGRWQLFSAGAELPVPGSECDLQVRLKRPHGAANPAGFDFESWLLSEGVTATGTVIAITCRPPGNGSMDGLRLQVREAMSRRFPERPEVGVLLALITGDRSLVNASSWADYAATGVVHLMAISGLHVMMLAGVAGALLLRLLRLWPRLALWKPLQSPVLIASLCVAILYSMLAGFSVPTERTLVMVAVTVLVTLTGRRMPPFHVLLLAMVVVLGSSPLAVHAAGFWLSFGAVTVLMLAGDADGELPGWRQVIHLQFLVTLMLLPLSLWFFDRVSWVSPFANLIAVPLVTFGIVPLGLAGFLTWLAGWEGAAGWCWEGGLRLVGLLDALMTQFAAWPAANVAFSLPGAGGLLWLVLAVAALIQPVTWRLRLLAPLFLLPLVAPAPALVGAELRMTVIDVGQGLSVLVETAHHRLVYDTGPALGPHADAGERHVVPVLLQRGIRHLDTLMLSHGDLDHTGGAASLLSVIRVDKGLGAAPPMTALPSGLPWRPCAAGQSWQWDGWHFAVLYPESGERESARNDNDRSCVLMIEGQGLRLLLPGDLEKPGEDALLARVGPEALRADVLVVGHHGSRTSTSPAFLAAVRPRWALVSAGYRNAFRHPSAQVIRRLVAAGVISRNTASDGALTLAVDSAGNVSLERWRTASGHYWQADDASAVFADWHASRELGDRGVNR